MTNYPKESFEVLKEILKEVKQNKVSSVIESELVVKDSNGLMWDKNGSDKEMTFADAEKYCKELTLGGFTDWRMPTRPELLTLVDDTKYNPAIKDGFKTRSSYYWTSTPYAGGSDGCWVVNFCGGHVYNYNRLSLDYVRPVRQYLN